MTTREKFCCISLTLFCVTSYAASLSPRDCKNMLALLARRDHITHPDHRAIAFNNAKSGTAPKSFGSGIESNNSSPKSITSKTNTQYLMKR